MFYGEPRLTLDIDLAVALPNSTLPEISRWFPEPEFYTPPEEVLALENSRACRAHFNIIHVPTGSKADFYPSQFDEFFVWAWRNRRTVPYLGQEVHYAPPEYVIVWKVAYFAEGGGEKHIRDIRRMLELSKGDIDQAVLAEELDRRSLAATYQRLLSAG